MNNSSARNYTRKGWAVFPLVRNSKTPAVKDWQSAATCDAAKVNQWERQFPGCNYGFIPSSANLIVIDIDAHNTEKDGRKSLADWERAQGKTLPETYTVTTPNGGLHLYYITRPDFPLTKKVNYLDGVDLIRSNGYVVTAGSTIDGREYTGNDTPVEVLPEWAEKAFLTASAAPPSSPDQPPPTGSAAGAEDLALILEDVLNMPAIEEGNRDNRLFALCADWKERGADERMMLALLKLTDSAGKIAPGTDPKTEEDFRRIAHSAWKRKETVYGSHTIDALFGDDAGNTLRDKGKTGYSAAELETMEIPPTKYLVDGLIPEGVSILAGQAKAGKTFLTLDLAASIAKGEPFLGRGTVKRRVLYCNLESSPGQTKNRLTMIKGDFYDFPQDMYLIHELPPLTLGGIKVLRKAIGEIHPELVIFDTWQKVRTDAGPKNATAYAREYLELTDLKNAIYRDLGVSVLLIHHLKQVPRGAIMDPVQLLNGSSAIGGAVDTILVLNRDRGAEEATLTAHGRDISDVSIALVKTEPMGWKAIGGEDGEGGASSVDLTPHTSLQQKIVDIMSACPDGVRARDILVKIGGDAKYNSILRQLNRWYQEGKVDRIGKAFRMFESAVEDDPFGLA